MQTQPLSQSQSASPEGPLGQEEATQMQTQPDSGNQTEEEGDGTAWAARGGGGWGAGDEVMLTAAEEMARARKLYEEGPWAVAFDRRAAAAAAAVTTAR
jgi:hypothetical protein